MVGKLLVSMNEMTGNIDLFNVRLFDMKLKVALRWFGFLLTTKLPYSPVGLQQHDQRLLVQHLYCPNTLMPFDMIPLLLIKV